MAAASAFGWMLAYLRGPIVVSGWIDDRRRQRSRHDHVPAGRRSSSIVGDFVEPIPAIIIFMPVINELTETGGINPGAYGRRLIVTLAFGLITPPYGLALLMASKFVDVSFSQALVRSLPLYVVFFAVIAFCIFFPDVVLWLPKHVLPESVGCFKSPVGTGYICPG